LNHLFNIISNIFSEISKNTSHECEIVNLQVSHVKKTSDYRIMKPDNPITIFKVKK